MSCFKAPIFDGCQFNSFISCQNLCHFENHYLKQVSFLNQNGDDKNKKKINNIEGNLYLSLRNDETVLINKLW